MWALWGDVVAGFLMAAMGLVISFAVAAMGGIEEMGLVPALLMIGGGLACALIGVLWARKGFANIRRTRDYLDERFRDGSLPYVLSTFVYGERLFNDSIRIDRNYLIGRGGIVPRTYGEITRIYLYQHKTNFITDGREVRIIVQGSAQEETLCSLPVKKPSDDEVMRLFSVVKTLNPSVALGYR